MNYHKLTITACVILAALCVTAQNQDIRRGGAGGSGVSVAAGDRMTAVTNGTVVTLSADVQSGGLFPNGTTNISVTNMTSLASYNGKLIINSSQDAATSVQLLTTANDGIPAGGYFYMYFPSATVGGPISAEPGAAVTRFGSGLSIGGRYALVKFYKTSTTNWHVEGDLTVP